MKMNDVKKMFEKAKYMAAIVSVALTASFPSNADQGNMAEYKNQPITLYGVSVSPYVLKTRIVLAEKSVSYELVETLPVSIAKMVEADVPQDFVAASPLGKIPALKVGEWTIADSAAIAGFLDKAYPQPALQPEDAKEFALSIWFERYADETLSVSTRGLLVERVVKPNVLKVETDQAIVDKIINHDAPLAFDYLEANLKGKKWITGNTFTVADIAIVAQLLSYEIAGETMNKKRWPNLAAYLARAKERPSLKKVM